MSEFNPSPHDRLVIGGQVFQVMPHPSVPTFAFGQEGRKAFVYQLSNGSGGELYALKQFKLAFRVANLVDVCDALARFSRWPGLEVCARGCLHHGTHDDALDQFPDLEYAVLMPWITGSTWYDIVIGSKPLTRLDALTAANATAQVLSALEEAGLAHCDIAAPNVIINLVNSQAHLIDVEDLYAPGFDAPAALPAGTEGYAHKTASQGLWMPTADRFAGAVILAEMMAWHSAEIRKASDEEHYFAAAEIQSDSPRLRLMAETLGQLDQRLADLFNQMWWSATLEDCPRLKDWQSVIGEVFHREQLSKVVTDWQPITIPGVGVERVPAAPAAPEKPAVVIPPAGAPQSSPAPITIPKPALVASAQPAPGGKAGSSIPLSPAPSTAQVIKPMPPTGPVIEWRPLVIALPPAPAGAEVTQPLVAETTASPEIALVRPLLDLSHVDKRNRPLLVWTESPGAAYYLLQESESPDFQSPREHKIKANETRWHPTWGRSGQLFYRVQACSDDQTSPWSKVLIVRITPDKT